MRHDPTFPLDFAPGVCEPGFHQPPLAADVPLAIRPERRTAEGARVSATLRNVGIGLVCLAALLALGASSAALVVSNTRDHAGPAATVTVSSTALADEKLRAEIAQLRAETRKLNSDRGFLSENGAVLAALLTGVVAVGGLFLTLWKQITEQARQRDADRKQRDSEIAQQKLEREREQEARGREREQREADSMRRFEERFTAILAELGAESEAMQAGAAVSLLTFLRPEQEAFHRQVRLVALANLKVAHSEPVRKLLLHVFEQAARLAPPVPNERDLSQASLDGADLSELDISGADLTGTRLRNAILENVNLRAAHGNEELDLKNARVCGPDTDLHAVRFKKLQGVNVNFTEANLSAAHLEGGNLRYARFQKARLQAAHLEGADLRGAQFQRADLRDTYFTEKRTESALLDEAALRSISAALTREGAHFTAEHEQRLAELDAERKAKARRKTLVDKAPAE